MEDNIIRAAVLEDVQPIADIILRSWQNAYTGIIDPDFPKKIRREKYISIMTENIQNGRETVFVFERQDAVLGFISGLPAEKPYDAEVRGLYIDPDAQGQGIGSQLLEKMMALFRSQSRKKVIIWTLEGAKNNKFYQSRGGDPLERKVIEIGGKNYAGVGFVFTL